MVYIFSYLYSNACKSSHIHKLPSPLDWSHHHLFGCFCGALGQQVSKALEFRWFSSTHCSALVYKWIWYFSENIFKYCLVYLMSIIRWRTNILSIIIWKNKIAESLEPHILRTWCSIVFYTHLKEYTWRSFHAFNPLCIMYMGWYHMTREELNFIKAIIHPTMAWTTDCTVRNPYP